MKYFKYYRPEWKFDITSINSAFVRNYAGDFYFKGESHDFWEMVYVENGHLTVAEDEDIYELREGQAIFHAPMEFHRFWARKNEKPVFKIISFSLDTDIEHCLDRGVFTFDAEKRIALSDLYDDITLVFNEGAILHGRNEAKEHAYLSESRVFKKLEAFLLTIMSDTSPDERIASSASAERYRSIVEFMTGRVRENLSLDEIAQETHFSVSYVKKLFMMYAGCGAMHYFTRLKIVHSLAYIRRGMSISEVSEMFSFSSPNYFSSVFKREMGMLPTDYKHKESSKHGKLSKKS